MIDLHNHLLYHLDDGARSLEESTAMLEEAKDNGITEIVATPHIMPDSDPEQYEKSFAAVAAEAARRGIRLYRGAEYNGRNLPPRPPFTTLGEIKKGIVLIDFRIPSLPPEFRMQADDIFNAGYRIVIAHPERTFPPSMLNDLENLSEIGISYQITASSLLGAFGPATRNMAMTMLKRGLARLVASDAHDTRQRNNCMRAAYELIARKFGPEAVATLQQNARAVLTPGRTRLAPIPLRRFRFGFLKFIGQ